MIACAITAVISLILGGLAGYGWRSHQVIQYLKSLECQHIWDKWEFGKIITGSGKNDWDPAQHRTCIFCGIQEFRRKEIR